MNELETGALPGNSVPWIEGIPKILKRIKNRWEVELLRAELKEAADNIANGEASLLPGQGVYVVLLNGNNAETVERLRKAKGRRPEQREATVVPPKKLFEIVDFPLLKELNPRATKEVIINLYRAHPCGLVLPCLEEAVPQHLITYHEVGGRDIPTVMNIWLSHFRIFSILWEEISRYPHVLLAGSSANRTGFRSPIFFEEAYPYLSSFVASAVKDPNEAGHFYKGSHTILNLIKNPVEVARISSVDPVKHPHAFRKFTIVVPDLQY